MTIHYLCYTDGVLSGTSRHVGHIEPFHHVIAPVIIISHVMTDRHINSTMSVSW